MADATIDKRNEVLPYWLANGLCALEISFTTSSNSLLAELILVSICIPKTEKTYGGRRYF